MLRSDASVAAFAACVGFACYLNSVICGFVFDDRLAIIDNADVQHGAPLADVWVNDFWGKSLRKTDSHKSYRPLTVLNLFAHTGGSSLACAAGGAEVTPLDGARSAVGRARANAEASGLGDAAVRWIADDVLTYVSRAAKRGERYDGVILDPPKYGRGPTGEVWRLFEDLPQLLSRASEIEEEVEDLIMEEANEIFRNEVNVQTLDITSEGLDLEQVRAKCMNDARQAVGGDDIERMRAARFDLHAAVAAFREAVDDASQ